MKYPDEFQDSRMEDQFDEIDAVFFTGDGLFSNEAIERCEWYLLRWQKRLNEIKEIVKESEDAIH